MIRLDPTFGSEITVALPAARHAKLTRQDGLQHSQVSAKPLDEDETAALWKDLETPEGVSTDGPTVQLLPHGAQAPLCADRAWSELTAAAVRQAPASQSRWK
eukprot:COSAG04_NODE_56_length_30604_cov_692.571119_16_plen_102_part_00